MDTLHKKLKNGSALIVLIRLITFIILISLCLAFTYSPIRDRLSLKKNNAEYAKQLAILKVDVTTLEMEKLEIEQEKELLVGEVESVRKEINTLNDDIANNLDKYIELKNRYGYAIYYDSDKADFGLAELIYLNSVCEEYKVPIAMMLAIFEKESGFCSTAKNPSSTATGYGQLLNTTAQSVYEKFLGLGTYDIANHRTVACDKKLNILMATRLIKYNIDTYGSYWKAAERYYGSKSEANNYAYAKDIDKRMKNYGASLN